jgi:hypothetical protein
MASGAVLIYTTIDVQHKINKSTTPPALIWLLGSLSVLNFLFINMATALAVIRLQQKYYQMVLIYMVASFSVLLLIADVSVWQVRSLVVKYQDRSSSAVRSKALAAEKSLYPLYLFISFLNGLLLLVIAALIYQTIAISQADRTNDPPDRADPREWKLDVFAWVHVIAIWLFIWWSWVPLHVLRPLLRSLGYEFDGNSHTIVGPDGTTIHPNTGREGPHFTSDRRGTVVTIQSHARTGSGTNQAILVAARDSARNSKRMSGSFNGKMMAQMANAGGGTAGENRVDKSPTLPAGLPLHSSSKRSTLEQGQLLKPNEHLVIPNLHTATTLTSTQSRPSTPPGGGRSVTLPGAVNSGGGGTNSNMNSMITVTAAANPQGTPPGAGAGKSTNGFGSNGTSPAIGPRSLPSGGSMIASTVHTSQISPFQGRSANDVAELSVSREEDGMTMLDTNTEENPSAQSSPMTMKEQMTLISPTSGNSSSSGSGGPEALTLHHPSSSQHEVPLSTSPRRPSMNVFARQPLSISTSSSGSGNASERQQGGGATPLRGDLPSSSTPNGLTTNSNFLLASDRHSTSTSPMRGKMEVNNAR